MAIHGTIEQHHLDAIKANSRVRGRLGIGPSTSLERARILLSGTDELVLSNFGLTSDELSAMFSWVTGVDRYLFLDNNNLTNLDGLSSLTSVGSSRFSFLGTPSFDLSLNKLTDVTGVDWENLVTPHLNFDEALPYDADVVSVLAPMLGNEVSGTITRAALRAYPEYLLLTKPDNYVQEDEPTGVKKGDSWFKPSTCELKIFTE